MRIKGYGICWCHDLETRQGYADFPSLLEDQQTKRKWHDWAHVFINGSGLLNTWKWPDIEGLHGFKGDLMHSAKWNHDVDFTNKIVGIIGTGSTSVQIIPQLQKVVNKAKVFMRSPTWISPPFGGSKSFDTTNSNDRILTLPRSRTR
jgi:cation diffusion facilitator CzcD-associated flavoprotein CzcO